MNMVIGIATDGQNVSEHFGKCQFFSIVEVENGKVIKSKIIDTTGFQHGMLPTFLATYGVKTVVAGGMGGGMYQKLKDQNFDVFVGISGDIDKAVQAYINGTLESKQPGCSGHSHEGHSHNCGCGH